MFESRVALSSLGSRDFDDRGDAQAVTEELAVLPRAHIVLQLAGLHLDGQAHLAVDLRNEGTIEVGARNTAMFAAITGDFEQTSAGRMVHEFAMGGDEIDQFWVFGHASLAGELVVEQMDEDPLAVEVTIISAAAISGSRLPTILG